MLAHWRQGKKLLRLPAADFTFSPRLIQRVVHRINFGDLGLDSPASPQLECGRSICLYIYICMVLLYIDLIQQIYFTC